jgi:hypothetical protein
MKRLQEGNAVTPEEFRRQYMQQPFTEEDKIAAAEYLKGFNDAKEQAAEVLKEHCSWSDCDEFPCVLCKSSVKIRSMQPEAKR